MRLPPRPLPAAPLRALLLAALLAGCGGPPPPPPPPDAPPGYVQLRETFGPRDFGPLAGRLVVLDPGHGGFFRGALGPEGLAEADVNLGVALNLRGLLEWAGAEVVMTRTADYDFLSPADSSLVADLSFRSSLVDSVQPDVFLSIHHNSTASADPTANETQTYYPLGDDGASLDLARAIHRHLVLNLEISPARILPGNFHVLRRATVPAVLGEPAMISHPVMEGRLSQAAAQRLEAEAYFLGLLDYFAAGDPRWLAAQPDTVTLAAADTVLAWTFTDTGPAAPPPDPATFAVRVDGEPAAAVLSADGATVRWRCPPARHGEVRRVAVTGRNLAGRRARAAGAVVLPGTARRLEAVVLGPAADGWPGFAHLAVRSADGRPLPEGRIGWPDQGEAGLLSVGGAPAAAGVVRRGAGPPLALVAGPAPDLRVTERPLPDGHVLLAVPDAGDRPWADRLAGADAPPALVGGLLHRPGAPLWRESPGRRPLVAAAGDTVPAPAGEPLLPGVAGAVVVIDPAGGGAATDGAGPLGLRGADVNLAAARRLADLLAGCGARAVLTRDEGSAPAAPDRVALAERTGADLFLTVGRVARADSAAVAHHPGSPDGTAWAGHAAAALRRLLPDAAVAVGPSWGYLLRHTACPALEIRLPGPADPETELRLDRPAWQAAEARALLLGIAGALEPAPPPAVDPAALLPGLPGAPPPAAVRWARWDGNLPWYPLPPTDGAAPAGAVSSGNEPGLPAVGPVHHLELHTADRWQLWRLERTGTGDWSGRLLLTGVSPPADHE